MIRIIITGVNNQTAERPFSQLAMRGTAARLTAELTALQSQMSATVPSGPKILAREGGR